ncbi:hypothetical protein RJ53_02645 [Methanocalculus chunghsingensis]|uniref:NADH:quinone oxidoreductase/Mrp antiporter transmembrane domain-containing protein n=1 Tax=Methanocalculus chunghsingensis TaxID=156457 RepID=A0A8J7W537_9EURY|nr:proton-conducting transporter membrane subunit [Methanocalculus chunghsingensis]MBR1368459.1 hypothetical protein [Methanocalculus chunghsingensis]
MIPVTDHLPILVVMIPVITAYITPLVGILLKRTVKGIAVVALSVNLACSLLLAHYVLINGPISYHLSGVPPPLGIEFVADHLGAVLSLLISAITLIAIIYLSATIPELGKKKTSIFYTLILLAVGGMQGIVLTNDLFNLFVLIEILAIAMYGLVAIRGDGKSLLAGYKYLLIGSAGSALILIGTGFLFISTGTLNMTLMGDILPDIINSWTVLGGFALLIAGLSTKIGLFPLHIWMPDAYAHAPSITPVISTLALKAGLVALIRLIYVIFGPSLSAETVPLPSVLSLLGAVAIIICSIVALQQADIRRMLAYSTGANIGCIVLGISFATSAGLEGAMLHMITHTVSKVCLFIAADAMLIQAGIRRIEDFRGLADEMPYTMAGFSLGAISIIGIPLSGGFMSKIYVANAAIGIGLLIYAGVILFWTLLTALYFFRIFRFAYFEPSHREHRLHETPWPSILIILILGGASILLGFFVEVPMEMIRPAAGILLGGGI